MTWRKCSIVDWSVFIWRKPDHSAKGVSKILDKIPEKYLTRIVLHRVPELLKDYPVAGYHHASKEKLRDFSGSCSRSFHSISNLCENREKLDYSFFGPVYNSDLKARLWTQGVDRVHSSIFCLGKPSAGFCSGRDSKKQGEKFARTRLFRVALLGAVWGRKDPVHALEGFVKVRDSILLESEQSAVKPVKKVLKEMPPSLESLRQ